VTHVCTVICFRIIMYIYSRLKNRDKMFFPSFIFGYNWAELNLRTIMYIAGQTPVSCTLHKFSDSECAFIPPPPPPIKSYVPVSSSRYRTFTYCISRKNLRFLMSRFAHFLGRRTLLFLVEIFLICAYVCYFLAKTYLFAPCLC
jgi:hypothetical protein